MTAGTRLPETPEPMRVWRGAQGLRLAGDTWGDPSGPLVVLMHGGGQTRHAWKGSGELLGKAGYHAVAFDARGHGDSEWASDGSYGQDVMVEDLQRVLEALGSSRPVLVGASMGGGTSLVAVGDGYVDATALILVDIAPRVERQGVDKIKAFMALKPEGFNSLEEVADAIGTYQPHRARPKNLGGLAKNVRLDGTGKYRWHWDPRIGRRNVNLDRRQQRLEECARRLTLPTLLIRGGLSDVLSEAGAQEFLALCPHAEYINVTDAAHMVAGDRNDKFGKGIISFLTRTVPTGSGPIHPPGVKIPRPAEAGDDIVDVP